MKRTVSVCRVAIVEDHSLQRERTVEVLRERAGMQVVRVSEDLPQFVDWLRRSPPALRPHLLVLDLSVDRGPSADPRMVAELVRSGMGVLVFSAMASPALVRQVIQAGAGGVVGKRDSVDDLVEAARTVASGGEWMTPDLASVIVNDPARPPLSDQEERALVLYASGLTLDSVAMRIGVKRDTAKKYIDRVKAKYRSVGREPSSRTDLYRFAVADGYLDEALSGDS
ncbi:response regulator transcription factor [Skermania sp. ID1734]|uniref:response regulator transcription factor n=1 Tax=Skermania sp. ID1734 TaxID=2597516 RepID=UPI00163D47B9|nr:response regulator transcription factor [Skermania sp. ID1734]